MRAREKIHTSPSAAGYLRLLSVNHAPRASRPSLDQPAVGLHLPIRHQPFGSTAKSRRGARACARRLSSFSADGMKTRNCLTATLAARWGDDRRDVHLHARPPTCQANGPRPAASRGWGRRPGWPAGVTPNHSPVR